MKKAYIKHILSLMLFGTNGVIASFILLSSYEIVLFRTLIGSALLLLLFKAKGEHFQFFRHKRDSLFLLLSGISMGASWMFLYESYQQIGVGIGTLIYYCGPVIVMVLSPLMFGEKLTVPKIFGFFVVLAGLFFLSGDIMLSHGSVWGIACGLLSAVTYFSMVTMNKKSVRITGMENAVLQLIISFFTVSLFILIKQGFAIDLRGVNWLPILLLGVLNTGIGCYLYFSTLSTLPVQSVAVLGYLEPLLAVLFSALFLSESMGPLQWIGAVCIIGGAMIVEFVKTGRDRS